MKLSRRHMLLAAAALPAACASPNPALFTLAPVAGRPRPGGPRNVELRGVSLPHYLERSEIVRSTEDFRVDVLPNDWWGESLSSMINRVLIQDIAQRLPDSTVFADTSAISVTPGSTVSINIQRFDQDRSGAVLLQGELAIAGAHAGSRHIHIAERVQGPAVTSLVGAMSQALGQLADTVADMLAGQPH